LRGLFLPEASAPEDVHQPIVPFVAGILKCVGTSVPSIGKSTTNSIAGWPDAIGIW
jgi:hypothetical protein